MNDLLLFLLQLEHGLCLDDHDIQMVAAAHHANQSIEPELLSSQARMYLRENPGWRDTSYTILKQSALHGVRWSYPGCDDYPAAWLPLDKLPPLFCYQGEPFWKDKPMISVVGSRTPMAETLQWMNRELGMFLQNNDVGVISGGARGVDQWSHRLAINHKRPTACIFPCGLLTPYPIGQEPLWQKILETGGALMSTFGLREPMRKYAFHIRNKWIAALGAVCFVAEANRRSGSHMTSGIAIELGKQVCTLPVSAMSNQGLANLDLIHDGCAMLRTSDDLVDLFKGEWAKLERGSFESGALAISGPSAPQGLGGHAQEKQIH